MNKKILVVEYEKFDKSALKYFNQGESLIKEKKFIEANDEFLKALKIDNDNDIIKYNVMTTYMSIGDYENALIQCNQCIDSKPLEYEYVRQKAIIYYALSNHTEVIKWQSILNEIENSQEAQFQIGQSYGKLGDTQEAIENQLKSIKLNNQFIDSHYNLGILQVKLQQYENAKEQFQNALKMYPSDVQCLTNLGLVYQNIKEQHKAIKYYNDALELNQDHPTAIQNKAIALQGIDKYQESIDQLLKQFEIKKNDPHKQKALTQISIAYYYIDNMDKASIQIELALKDNPDQYLAVLTRAQIQEKQLKYNLGQQQYELCINMNDEDGNKDVEPIIGVGNCQFNLNCFQQALPQFERGLQEESNINQIIENDAESMKQVCLYNCALCNYHLSEFNKAIYYFDLQISEDVQKDQSWYLRGVCQDRMKKWEDAIQNQDQCLELNPKEYRAITAKAYIIGTFKDRDHALELLNKSSEIKPDYEPTKYYIEMFNRDDQKEGVSQNDLIDKIDKMDED